jgi:regulation of enolase protein 1 (concanavalin A-like superfamily)
MGADPWAGRAWLNEPPAWHVEDGALHVRTAPGTDFWRVTSYGFTRDSGHFLGAPIGREAGLDLRFTGAFDAQFDQAGLMLRAGPDRWVKAGVEVSDGVLYVSVVATAGRSDWSVSPLPGARPGLPITIRASRAGDAVTIRYGVGDSPATNLLRLLPLDAGDDWLAGPFCCSPDGPGTDVTFQALVAGAPDAALHPG